MGESGSWRWPAGAGERKQAAICVPCGPAVGHGLSCCQLLHSSTPAAHRLPACKPLLSVHCRLQQASYGTASQLWHAAEESYSGSFTCLQEAARWGSWAPGGGAVAVGQYKRRWQTRTRAGVRTRGITQLCRSRYRPALRLLPAAAFCRHDCVPTHTRACAGEGGAAGRPCWTIPSLRATCLCASWGRGSMVWPGYSGMWPLGRWLRSRWVGHASESCHALKWPPQAPQLGELRPQSCALLLVLCFLMRRRQEEPCEGER